MVDEVPEEHSRSEGPGRVHSSTGVVHLQNKKACVTLLCCKIFNYYIICVFFRVSHPHEMSDGDGEANG